MYKRVDGVEEDIKGFCYINQDGRQETVGLPDIDGICKITVKSPDDTSIFVYKEDIPYLVKALQSVYGYKGE